MNKPSLYNPYEVIMPQEEKREYNPAYAALTSHRILCFVWALLAFVSLLLFDNSFACRLFALVAIVNSLVDAFIVGAVGKLNSGGYSDDGP